MQLSVRSVRRFLCPSSFVLCSLWLAVLFLVACSQPPAVTQGQQPVQVQLAVDGQTYHLTTHAATVRELLVEAGVMLEELDEVDPPLFTPLREGAAVTVVRVMEEVQALTESIPFERKFVRTDTMSAEDAPQIVQSGQPGLREVTLRLVYRDGLETSRIRTGETILQEPQDEVVLIGIGANRGIVYFSGLLAYIGGGVPVLMRGNTAVPEQLAIEGQLDGRVFALSPDATHLLYTQVNTSTGGFNNSLWRLAVEPGAAPEPLGVQNVLWAGWNPVVTDTWQIAYTTAVSTEQPPGWEANNDLWLLALPLVEGIVLSTSQIIDTYPALNGWWGGNYAWSPNGRTLAYSFANEVGLIDTRSEFPNDTRLVLHRFTPFNTRADWVWVPSLTWSPDGGFLAYTEHSSNDEEAMQFDSQVVGIHTGVTAQFVDQAGMWGHLHWSPDNQAIAFLRTTDPLDSLRSNYTLWLMDVDGSNGRQIYPPIGENSAFSREQSFMAWGPDGQHIAFIFDDDLFILNLEEESVTRVTQDDTRDSHPTWAPYGAVGPAAPPTGAPPRRGG